jgi:ribonuclease HI
MAMVVYCDGLCEPVNPAGHACWAWVAVQDGALRAQARGYLGHGPGMTNNLAEYHALLEALRAVQKADEHVDEFRTDSKLVVEQVNGRWAVNAPALRPLVEDARRLLKETGGRLIWVPRAENERADALSRREYAQRRVAG